MLSRVAETIYWMSRYLERAENVARFLDVNLQLILDLSFDAQKQWQPLIDVTGDREDFQARFPEADQKSVLHFLTFDRKNPNSIYSAVHAARENARTIREIISTEMWEQVNRYYYFIHNAATQSEWENSPHEFFDDIKTHHQLFIGLCEGTMSHGEAWHFMTLGRMLERADQTTRILDVKYFILLPKVEYVGTTYDNLQWAALLKSTSALEMYRKEFQHINPRNVADFLIFNGIFPRAIRHCLAQADYSLHRITGTYVGTYQNQAEQKMGKVRADLDFSNIDEVIREGLHQYLDNFQAYLNEAGEAIFHTFFAPKTFPEKNIMEASQ